MDTEKADVGSAGAGESCPTCGTQMGVEDWACAKCGAIAGTVDKFPARPDARHHRHSGQRPWIRRFVSKRAHGSKAGAGAGLTLTPLGIAVATGVLVLMMAAVYLIGRSAW
jgi:hypothetical protein